MVAVPLSNPQCEGPRVIPACNGPGLRRNLKSLQDKVHGGRLRRGRSWRPSRIKSWTRQQTLVLGVCAVA